MLLFCNKNEKHCFRLDCKTLTSAFILKANIDGELPNLTPHYYGNGNVTKTTVATSARQECLSEEVPFGQTYYPQNIPSQTNLKALHQCKINASKKLTSPCIQNSDICLSTGDVFGSSSLEEYQRRGENGGKAVPHFSLHVTVFIHHY